MSGVALFLALVFIGVLLAKFLKPSETCWPFMHEWEVRPVPEKILDPNVHGTVQTCGYCGKQKVKQWVTM